MMMGILPNPRKAISLQTGFSKIEYKLLLLVLNDKDKTSLNCIG